MNKIRQVLNRGIYWGKRNSPKILTAAGIVLSLKSAYDFAKAGSKTKETVVPYLDKIESLKNTKAKEKDESRRRELSKQIKHERNCMVVSIAKLYALPVTELGTGVGSFVWSNQILTNRNTQLAAALSSSNALLAQYRENVKGKVGDKAEEALFTTKKDENGNTVPMQNNIYCITLTPDNCEIWNRPDARVTLSWLASKEQELTNVLKFKENISLETVIDAVGYRLNRNDPDDIILAKAMKKVGWVYNPKCPKCHNIVSFGIGAYGRPTECYSEYAASIDKPETTAIRLIFNIDGAIDGSDKELFWLDHNNSTFNY